MNRDVTIIRAMRVDARCEPRAWPWAEENRAAIARNWAELTADRPSLFNGRVLLIADLALESETCRARYFETDFADFIGWRDFGYPDTTIANGFAMGALRGSDGAYICGVMAGHTANAGRVYFPAGTPDRSDLRPDGTVDLAASVTRELKEETSLSANSYEIAEHWIVVRQWPAVAFLRPITFAEPAAAVAERIRANIAQQSEPELADARVIRGPEDIDPHRMPLFLQSFFRAAFAAQR